MTRSEPKAIINLTVKDEDLNNAIQDAMDKYVENLVLANLDNTIAKNVEKRIGALINAERYSPDGKIKGKPLDEYVKERTNSVIENIIEQNIRDIFAKKVAEML